jgi:hypothetical protein
MVAGNPGMLLIDFFHRPLAKWSRREQLRSLFLSYLISAFFLQRLLRRTGSRTDGEKRDRRNEIAYV